MTNNVSSNHEIKDHNTLLLQIETELNDFNESR